jgi:putative acetyltransferase
MQLSDIHISTVKAEDDSELANIIRATLTEFGLNKPGTVYYDKETDHLSEVFKTQGSVYYVARNGKKILGGAGIYPSNGLPEQTCELVKMYLVPEARNMGLGSLLIQKAIQFAKKAGYSQIYLESMPELNKALSTYARFGFQRLDKPLGNTGHFGCDVWMLLNID